MVEFALVMPFLLILTFITTEFGRALYQYNALTKSVRDAARYLSMYLPGDPARITIAKNLVVYGNPAGTGSPLAYGLALSHVPDPVWETAGAAPLINTVTISIVNYTFTPIVASAFGVNFAAVSFGRDTTPAPVAGSPPPAPERRISATMRVIL